VTASPPVLGARALGRALLARQLLLGRQRRAVGEVLELLVGLQAQAPAAPYVALWNRLEGFDPADLSGELERRAAVRIALMRSTLFLVTAADALALRPLLQPVQERTMLSNHGPGLAGADPGEVARRGRELADQEPRTFEELGALLADIWPAAGRTALGAAVRALVPLVQVPPRGLWGRTGPATHTSLESWLGGPATADARTATPARLLLRYLAAYGPASVRDMQAWSGLTGLREVVQGLGDQVVALRSEAGTRLYDLPDAPRPGPDVTAPARLLAGFDVLLLSHADRTRILSPQAKALIFTVNGIIRPAVLLDGVVAGRWRAGRPTDPDAAEVVVEPFRPLSPAEEAAVEEEAHRYAAWAAPGREARVQVGRALG
jgi:hypothetical protein